MTFVSYSKSNYYFLTDAQFEEACKAWASGMSHRFTGFNALLPPPRTPAGVLPEHEGLDIRFCWEPAGFPGSPGWIAFSQAAWVDGKEMARAALYRRAKVLGEDHKEYRWEEINVKEPHVVGGFGLVDHTTTTPDVMEFLGKIKTTPIDEILSNPALKMSVPFAPLLPAYFLE